MLESRDFVKVRVGKTYEVRVMRLPVISDPKHIPSYKETIKRMKVLEQWQDDEWSVEINNQHFKLYLNYERDTYFLIKFKGAKYQILEFLEVEL
jgi:hypothetical protein